MQKALDLARSAMDEKQDFPIAALLVVDDNIVAGAEVVKSFETPAGIVY
jgi:tRNA(Arg) A34 adenosine deaminase TadA